MRTLFKPVFAVIFSAIVLAGVQSCGRTKSKYQPKSEEQSEASTTTSPTAAGNVAIRSGDVDIPAGSVAEDGTVISMAETDSPEAFVQDPPLSAGSVAINISGDAPSGPVEELLQPVTVTLKVTNQPAQAALLETPASSSENLCVLGITISGKMLVWRVSSLLASDTTAGEIKFKSKWLGTFQVVFCGNLTLDAFAEVSQDGASEVSPSLASFGACDYSGNAALATKSCRMFTGIAFKPVANLDSNKVSCANAGGTFVSGGSCPDTATIGNCSINKDGAEEMVVRYYTGDASTIKTQCESNTGAVWETK